jgi:hypothetical protein
MVYDKEAGKARLELETGCPTVTRVMCNYSIILATTIRYAVFFLLSSKGFVDGKMYSC